MEGVDAVNTDNDTAEEKTEGGAVGAPPVGAPPMQQSEPAAPPAGVQVQIPRASAGSPRTALRVGAGIHGCELIFESDVPLPGGTRVSARRTAVED